jgi:hypothetical protein
LPIELLLIFGKHVFFLLTVAFLRFTAIPTLGYVVGIEGITAG